MRITSSLPLLLVFSGTFSLMATISDDLTKYARGKIWILRNIKHLERNYRGKYVAILGETVIDSDDDNYSLLQRLWARGLYPGPVIIHFVK